MSDSVKYLILASSFSVLAISFGIGVWAQKKVTSPEAFFGGAKIFGPLTVGLATPPMGLVLFVASSVSGEKVQTIAKAILPFLAVEVLVIFLITFIPEISMTIPRLTGFAD